MSSKVFVIGLDGATFDIIRPLVREGKLPTIENLMHKGVHGNLRSTIPPATLPAWPSFMTGKNPGKHGVFDFMGRESNEYYGRLMSSKDIHGDTIWRILSKFGKRSIVMNVPATYPPEKINGIIISGMLTPVGKSYTYPPELEDEIKDYVVEMDPEIYEKEESIFLDELYSIIQKRKDTALYLMKKYKWDFFMVMFRETDIIQHKLWGEKEKIFQFYQHIDEIINQLITETDDDTYIIIMSDHGFGELRKMVCINKWLTDLGLLSCKRKDYSQLRHVKLNELMGLKTKNSLNEIILFKLGFSRQRIKFWLEKIGLEKSLNLIPKSMRKRIRVSLPETDLDIDWAKTKAYFSSFFSAETQSITINLKGRDPEGIVDPQEYEEVRKYIIKKLHELRDPVTGEKVVNKVFRREEIYHGPFLNRAPDIVMLLKEGYKASGDLLSKEVIVPKEKIEGAHRMNGIFIVYGPEIKQGEEIKKAEIIDLAPTILHIMHIPIPKDMDGKVLKEIFKEGSELATREIVYQEIEHEKRKIKERIKELLVRYNYNRIIAVF